MERTKSVEQVTTKVNRWVVLFASVGIIICQGGIYAFSVFSSPLAAANGWSVPDVALAFTIAVGISPIPIIIGGRISDKGKSRELILFSSLLLAASFALAGLSTQLWQLYLTYGLLGGFGLNLGYIACVNNSQRFFPDKRGLCSGIVITGIGAGTMIFAPLGSWLIEHFGVRTTFIQLGVIFLVISLICSALIRNAPIESTKETVTEANDSALEAEDFDWKGMIKTLRFYLVALLYATGCFSGLVISSNAADIGQNMFGLTPMVAATFVSVYAMCNCFGRVLWGALSDKLTRINTFLLLFIFIAASLLSMIFIKATVGFGIGLIGLGLCEGGVAAMMSPLTIENFGSRNQGVNYGFVFLGFSIAAFIAPRLTAFAGEKNSGDFTSAFIIGVIVAVIGFILTFALKQINLGLAKKKR
ncbi:OFA family MFS transporter [Enterococcus hulanensis]|uniref:L-lactate MFS transporter n=1 Tax=Enterococcus hulanensis TaxID=2559929 RepID=UPI0010F5C102|nr:OFA family MFS transporter [Enterococcus hulanensis]MBO0457026.1 OFA family MFS transporter [Enterococcus hulanensis]